MSEDLITRAEQALEAGFIRSDDWYWYLVRELVAEIKRLHSWDGLMSILDKHYREWGLRYDAQPHDVVFGRAENPDGTVTRVTPMPSEKHARAAQASRAPIGAKNKTVVHRLVSEWEACDV